jgi:hypothetical protein
MEILETRIAELVSLRHKLQILEIEFARKEKKKKTFSEKFKK